MHFSLQMLIFLFQICIFFSENAASFISTTESSDDEESLMFYESFCKDLRNVSSRFHKRILYHQCLPYIIGLAKKDETIDNTDVYLNTLTDAPHADNYKKTTSVTFTSVMLLAYVVASASDFQPEIQAQFGVTWQDPRLTWDATKWRFDTYPIELKPFTQMWAPSIAMKSSRKFVLSSVVSLAESVTYYNVRVTSEGSVNATAFGQLTFNKCTSDLSSYPYDVLKCCADAVVGPSDRVLVGISGLTTGWDSGMVGIWQIQNIQLTGKTSKNVLRLCITARRNTAAVGLELSLPMAVSAVVLMCAQLAGKWKMQVYVKLFAILIQIFAFQNLSPNDALANATKMPKVYIFYNFTVVMTIISLFQTMFFWALSRRWFLMPPPYRLTLSTKLCSKFLLGDKLDAVQGGDVQPIENGDVSDQPAAPKSGRNRKEWEVIFATLHVIFSLLIVLAYVIGLVIIYAIY